MGVQNREGISISDFASLRGDGKGSLGSHRVASSQHQTSYPGPSRHEFPVHATLHEHVDCHRRGDWPGKPPSLALPGGHLLGEAFREHVCASQRIHPTPPAPDTSPLWDPQADTQRWIDISVLSVRKDASGFFEDVMLLLPTFHFACETTDFLALSRSDARLSGKAKAPCSVNSLRHFWKSLSEDFTLPQIRGKITLMFTSSGEGFPRRFVMKRSGFCLWSCISRRIIIRYTKEPQSCAA